MRLVLISDTHMAHERLRVPPADVLIHAGDFSRHGTRAEAEAFLAWFAAQPAAARVLTAGNHDAFADREPGAMTALARAHGVHYLVDAEARVGGLRIWASPITPRFGHWSFQRERGAAIRAHWDQIPAGLDVLVTHGPPRGVGDRTVFGAHVGCDDLREAIARRPPRLHVFGHIHEAGGEHRDAALPATRFINAASRRLLPIGVRAPIALAW